MNDLDYLTFKALFNEAYTKCFAEVLQETLPEPQCRYLSSEIEEKTGLVVGWKSIKNYAVYVISEVPEKQVNPSIATLDTLARYIYEAPAISEVQRKRSEANYPYWFRYKEQYHSRQAPYTPAARPIAWQTWIFGGLMLLVLLSLLGVLFQRNQAENIVENFHCLDENCLHDRGWTVVAKEPVHWSRRTETPGQLTLFTLEGDNWPESGEKPMIRNLLVRKVPSDCFHAEIQLSEFMPGENWQQAGLLVMEDTTYTGKCIRLSISYNDFFGGYSEPAEIIIQAIASYGQTYQNPEEITHHTLFTLEDDSTKNVVTNNLKNTAVKIEKQGNSFRFLYSASPVENFSYKELAVYNFDMDPQYVGVFALKGYVDSTGIIPAGIKFFRLENKTCKPSL